MDCPDCYGNGRWKTGTEWKTGIGGSYEVPVFKQCERCDGTGVLPVNDNQILLNRIAALEDRVHALEIANSG